MDEQPFSPNPPKRDAAPDEPVWTFRGYRLKASEFVTAMVHFFRAEVSRSNVWRQRLDATTNWAVISIGAILSIAFSQAGVHHGIIILNFMLVLVFLYIEARRYRYYELWSYRVRLMETDFFAAMLVPPFHPSPDWAEALAETLLSPGFSISLWEAVGRRLRHIYLWVFTILGIAWVAKIWLFPVPLMELSQFMERAAIGGISGTAIVAGMLVFYAALALTALLTVPMRRASGEVLPRFGPSFPVQGTPYDEDTRPKPWYSLRRRRQQFIAFVITDHTEAVSKQIIAELNRGVTALEGRGMYTETERSVLMIAVTVTEINNLKKVVAHEDPNAFVIVNAAQEVLGRGFTPLTEE